MSQGTFAASEPDTQNPPRTSYPQSHSRISSPSGYGQVSALEVVALFPSPKQLSLSSHPQNRHFVAKVHLETVGSWNGSRLRTQQCSVAIRDTYPNGHGPRSLEDLNQLCPFITQREQMLLYGSHLNFTLHRDLNQTEVIDCENRCQQWACQRLGPEPRSRLPELNLSVTWVPTATRYDVGTSGLALFGLTPHRLTHLPGRHYATAVNKPSAYGHSLSLSRLGPCETGSDAHDGLSLARHCNSAANILIAPNFVRTGPSGGYVLVTGPLQSTAARADETTTVWAHRTLHLRLWEAGQELREDRPSGQRGQSP